MATPENTRVQLNRSSWVRSSELQKVEDGDTGSFFIFWDLNEPLDIESTSLDIEYTVVSGDRIDKLANRFLGSPLLWWVIAQRNDLDLPAVDLYPGRKIIIPDPRNVERNILR